MTRDPIQRSHDVAQKPAADSPTAVICIWLIIQLLVIAIAAFRIPLWIHSPDATEYIALPILLSVQIVGSAMLSPLLCRNVATSLIAILTAWPFIVAANFLATASIWPVFWMGTYVAAWIAAMTLLQRSLDSSNRMNVAGLLGAWSAAGPVILIFVRNEQIDGSLPMLSEIARASMGPLMSAMPLIHDDARHSAWQWVAVGIVAIAGSGSMWVKNVIKRRASVYQTAC